MAEAKTREQLEKDWWDAWWAADFSWEGLLNQRISGGGLHGEKTLQDYWRRDAATGAVRDDAALLAAGELEDCGGVPFHIAHLPSRTRSNEPTWKAQPHHSKWQTLAAILTPRIAAAAETETDLVGDTKGPDGRAQFAGAVLRDTVTHPQGRETLLHVDARRMATIGSANYSNHAFGRDVRFTGAAFLADVTFYRSNFADHARFSNVMFSGDAGFADVTISGDAMFSTTTFAGDVRFYNTKIGGDARFTSATATETASFGSVVFSKDARFRGSTFHGGVNFDRAIFSGDADFENVMFAREISFYDARMEKDARFDDAKFMGEANFYSVHITGLTQFQRTTFNALANFEGDSEFDGNVNFNRATFNGVASFIGAKFGSELSLIYCQFLRRARFSRARLGYKYPTGSIDFEGARFAELADFDSVVFPENTNQFSAAFTGVRFEGVADFRRAGVHWIAALDEAIFDRKLILDDPDEVAAENDFRRKILPGALRAAEADVASRIEAEATKRADAAKESDAKPAPIKRSEKKEWLREARDRRLKELEGGCRVVKVAMGRDRDEQAEQRYYRFQLLARRKQRSAPRWEKVMSFLYGAVSGYGASMARPFAALVCLIVAFTATYWGLALAVDALHPNPLIGASVITDGWQALSFSWNNVFRPLSALSTESVKPSDGTWAAALLFGFGDGYGFGVRALATLQSIIAILLAFLFALAVRRRFQIS